MSHTNDSNSKELSSTDRGPGSLLSKMMREGRSFSSHERNCCYLNTGASVTGRGRFANISAVSGLDFPDDARALALTDWDQDGDIDIWISNRNAPRLRLMRNEQPSDNHSLTLRLQGNGRNTNRDAIGARVEVILGGKGQNRPLIKTLRAGEGFIAQSSKWLHFGLGTANIIEKVIVHWPGGEKEEFSGFEADKRYKLLQGSLKVNEMGNRDRETVLASSQQEIRSSSQRARVPMIELLPMPRSLYDDLNGNRSELEFGEGRLLLVNLWASWCPDCQIELNEFSSRYEELQSAGIDVLALSVEGLEQDAVAAVRAAKKFSKGKFPFKVGLATPSLVKDFQSEHNRHLPLHKRMPLPTSFLIDKKGRLSVIYKGKVSVDQLLKDVAHSKYNRSQRVVRSSPLGGQSIEHPLIEQVALNEAEILRFDTATEYQSQGRINEVARQYSDVLEFKPDSFMAHSNLGDALAKLGVVPDAIYHLQRASIIKPEEAVPYYNLANIFHGNGEILNAIGLYQKALRANPKFANAHKNLGIVLQERGELDEAISHINQAIQIMPDDHSLYLIMGQIVKKKGNLGQATEYYKKALKLNPKFAEAHSQLAIILDENKEIKLAIKHYQQAIKLKPQLTEARFNLANILYNQGEYLKSINHYNKVLNDMPDHPLVLSKLADAYLGQGMAEESIKTYVRVLEMKPDFPPAMNGLAWIRATHPDEKWRDGPQAVTLAERCCQITAHRMVPAIITLAAAYAEVNRFEDAVRLQSKAIELSPEGNKIQLQKNLDLYKKGRAYRHEM